MKSANAFVYPFVSKLNFINIGIITRVHNENYVDVNFYYKKQYRQKQAVRLHIGTTKCKLSPAVDNVLMSKRFY